MDGYRSLNLNSRYPVCGEKLGCGKELICRALPLEWYPLHSRSAGRLSPSITITRSQCKGTRGAEGDLLPRPSVLCFLALLLVSLQRHSQETPPPAEVWLSPSGGIGAGARRSSKSHLQAGRTILLSSPYASEPCGNLLFVSGPVVPGLPIHTSVV